MCSWRQLGGHHAPLPVFILEEASDKHLRKGRLIWKARRAEVSQSHSKHTQRGSDVFKHLATVAGGNHRQARAERLLIADFLGILAYRHPLLSCYLLERKRGWKGKAIYFSLCVFNCPSWDRLLHGSVFNMLLAVCFLTAEALFGVHHLPKGVRCGDQHCPPQCALGVDGLCHTGLSHLHGFC